MNRLTVRLVGWVSIIIGGCSARPAVTPAPSLPLQPMPNRIVSLDYCADQYVLKLVGRNEILALSPDAQKKFSYQNAKAVGIKQTATNAENVIALKPDLIVRSYGGGPNASRFFQTAGIPVINIGWSANIEQLKVNIQTIADQLGQAKKGQHIVEDMTQRLTAIKSQQQDRSHPSVLYMTPSGITSGSGSLVHEMMIEAGLRNFQTKSGWHPIPMERLAYEQPDQIAAAFFGKQNTVHDQWSAMRHPVAQKTLIDLPTTAINGAWTSCGAWYLVDAIEALAKTRTSLQEPINE